jgi:hypothetical protein
MVFEDLERIRESVSLARGVLASPVVDIEVLQKENVHRTDRRQRWTHAVVDKVPRWPRLLMQDAPSCS